MGVVRCRRRGGKQGKDCFEENKLPPGTSAAVAQAAETEDDAAVYLPFSLGRVKRNLGEEELSGAAVAG